MDQSDDHQAPDPFSACERDDVVEVRMRDGTKLTGAYMTQARMHFVHVKEGGVHIHGKVLGPFAHADVASVSVAKTRDVVIAERRERQRGEPVPGTLRRDADGYQARLETIARAAALVPFRRRLEIEHQFDDVADEIQLARTKRNYMLAVAKWARFSNRTPDKLDLSGGDMTSAERFQKPRPQDFDPDPKVRRARVKVPERCLVDPRSPQNMIKALRDAGFNARASVLGEVTFDDAELLVDFPGGKQKGRFTLTGARRPSGEMAWRFGWEGNGSKADQTRRRRAVAGTDYAVFADIVEKGRKELRADVAAPSPRP